MSDNEPLAVDVKSGDHVELTIRGIYRDRDNSDLPYLIETRDAGVHWLPRGVLRVVDPPEPATVGTVVTGWPHPDDARPRAMYVFVLTGADADGDGAACWQAPGETHEYAWPAVLADTLHGRRIIAPPTSSTGG